MKIFTKAILVLVCCSLLASPALAGEVKLSVAASLKDVIDELADNFARKHPGVSFVKNYGGSGQLAKQIENGAPADIFISANVEWMTALVQKGLVDPASQGTFAYNTLVFASRTVKVSSLKDLARLERIAIGSPKSVPAGRCALEAMKKAGLDGLLAEKFVMAKDVRECLLYAEMGEADGGFVYRTDALQAKKARILFTVPQGLYPRVVYPMALTSTGTGNRNAAAFLGYLKGREAKAALTRHGFITR